MFGHMLYGLIKMKQYCHNDQLDLKENKGKDSVCTQHYV